MKLLRLTSLLLTVALAVTISGCAEKKKPVLVMPQQPPPTATPEASPTPVPAAEASPPEQQNPAQPTESATSDQAKQQDKAKTKTAKRPAQKKPSPSTPASGDKPAAEVARNTPPKKVVQEPARPDTPPVGQISPGPTPASARDQASTEQLLQSAEANLNGIKRQLSPDEENMRAQIREFITQSHKATSENDPARAHTLAVKARLLSDDLVKQR